MSTAYQVVFGNNDLIADIEDDYRFYKKRDYCCAPQNSWLYEIYKNSMNSKVIGQGLVAFLYFVIQTITSENLIATWVSKSKLLHELKDVSIALVRAHEEDQILKLLSESDHLYGQM